MEQDLLSISVVERYIQNLKQNASRPTSSNSKQLTSQLPSKIDVAKVANKRKMKVF